MYHVRISKEEVLKLRCLYIMYGSLKKKFLKLSIYLAWNTKEQVLKLRLLYIMCGSLKKEF